MKIKTIRIEGMHNVLQKTYTLSDLTYLHGPNGVGKSTVMQAIQLALLGYIPGTSKASKDAIFKHSNGHVLAVTLLIDDDGEDITISRVWSGTKSNINSSIEITPAGYDIHNIISELELPIFNFNEFMNMTANKLKDWFIEFLPSSELVIDWKSVLTTDAIKSGFDVPTTFIDDTVSNIKDLEQSGSDEIRAVNEQFKAALSFKKKELERAKSTIQSLIFYDDVDTSMTESEIDTQIKIYTDIKASRDKAIRDKAANERIVAELKSYDKYNSESYESDPEYLQACKDYTEVSDKILESQNNIIKYQSEITELDSQLSALFTHRAEIQADSKAKQSIIDSDGICPFTQTKCESIQPIISEYAEAIRMNTIEIESIHDQIKTINERKESIQAEINELNSTISTIAASRSKYIDIQKNVQSAYITKSELSKKIVIVPDIEDDDRDFDALIEDLQNIKIKLAANKRYNELIDTLTANKFSIEQEVGVYKSWINLTGVNGLQNVGEDIGPFKILQDEMNKYIQNIFSDSVTAKFNLENKANSFSFGITRGSDYIPYNLLSSGEKCLYTLALMISLTTLSDSKLKIVMVDDLLDHLDDVNIVKLFDSLKNIQDVQMIFAGVKDIEGDFVLDIDTK